MLSIVEYLAINLDSHSLAESILSKTPSTVSKWCQNTIQPDIKTLNEIANLLDIDVKDLLVSNKEGI